MPDAYNNRRHCMGHHRSVQLQHRGRYIWFRHSILEDHIYTGGSCRIVHHIFLLVSRQRSVIILINIQKMPTDILSAGIFWCWIICCPSLHINTIFRKSHHKISLTTINPIHTASESTSGIEIILGLRISEPSSANLICLRNIPKTSSFLQLMTARAYRRANATHNPPTANGVMLTIVIMSCFVVTIFSDADSATFFN